MYSLKHFKPGYPQLISDDTFDDLPLADRPLYEHESTTEPEVDDTPDALYDLLAAQDAVQFDDENVSADETPTFGGFDGGDFGGGGSGGSFDDDQPSDDTDTSTDNDDASDDSDDSSTSDD